MIPPDYTALETPTRYDQWCHFSHGHSLMEKPQGALVKYEDYAKLLSHAASLQQEIAMTRETNRAMQQTISELHAQVTARGDEIERLKGAIREWSAASVEADELALGWTQRVQEAEQTLRECGLLPETGAT